MTGGQTYTCKRSFRQQGLVKSSLIIQEKMLGVLLDDRGSEVAVAADERQRLRPTWPG